LAKTVMVVEDDRDIRDLLCELLEVEGYSVTAAENGEEALITLRANQNALPSLILLDLMMPVMDGFHFRQEQLRDPVLSRIPVMVMTAGHRDDKVITQLAPRAFIRKPLDVEEVLKLVSCCFPPAHSSSAESAQL